MHLRFFVYLSIGYLHKEDIKHSKNRKGVLTASKKRVHDFSKNRWQGCQKAFIRRKNKIKEDINDGFSNKS